MYSLIDAALNRSRTVLSILVLLLIAGTYSYITIPKESSPDINIPQIYVSLHHDGISPADSERLLLRPMEQELSAIEGVKEMKSTAYQSGGYVLLEFQAGFDKEKALDDVREAVDKGKPELPDEADEPQVSEVNFSLFPVLVVTLSGDVPERTLLQLSRNLQDKIESLSFVLEAPIVGDRDELVEITIDPEVLKSYELDGASILSFFQRSNRLVAAGNLDTGAGRFAVEVPGLFESVDDIYEMPVLAVKDSAIKLKDVATIRRTFKDPDSFARLNGERAIAIEVVKRTGENVIDTIDAVRKIVAQEQEFWPDGVNVTFTQDNSDQIRTMLSDLQNNMISAILLVMIVVVAALGLRAAALVGVAIPGAFLTGILLVYAMGLTVNVVVLFALILSVGMLVDGAVVVTEYADRKMAEGMDRKDAYREAAKRMAWPITSSTATTLAAFGPLLFWPDVVGEFMKYMPITLICVLGSSLLMALIFVPTLGAIFGRPGATDEKALKTLTAAETGDLMSISGFTGGYVRVLNLALKKPSVVLLIAVVMLFGVIMSYKHYGRGVEFFPEIEPEQISVLIHARGNLSVYEQDKLVQEVERRVLLEKGLKTAYVRSGSSDTQRRDVAEDTIGQIQVELLDWDERPPANEIIRSIAANTADISGIHAETRKQEEGPPSGKDVQIQIVSRFPEIMPPIVAMLRGALEEIGGFHAIEDTLPLPGIDWELRIDRAQASKFGVDTSLIGQYVRMVTNGLEVAEYRPNDSDDEIDVVLRHALNERTLDMLDRVHVKTEAGTVPISNFVKRVPKPAVGVINRVDQKRSLVIKADVMPGTNINAKVQEIRKWMEENAAAFDPRVEITFKGEDEDQREAQEFLMKAFVVALFIMAIILVTQFNSFYSAFLILTAVIMSTMGVLIGLMVTQQAFGIVMSGIGVIALAGIIVNNNIVLIDTYDHLKKNYGDKMSEHEIILRTGAQRMRPVLLTTVTTVLGLMPMVLQTNIDFMAREVSFGAPSTQWWVQLSTAVAFGLSFSTLLTLFVTPCALMIKENKIVRFVGRVLSWPVRKFLGA